MVFDVYGTTQDSWGSIGNLFQHFLIYNSEGLIFYLEDNDSEILDLSKGVREIVMSSPYAGETTEGIKIGSSRQDVINAYGEPDDISAFFGEDYDMLGLTFLYNDANTLLTSIELK